MLPTVSFTLVSTKVGEDVVVIEPFIPFVGASVGRSEIIVGPTVGMVVSGSSKRLVGVCVGNDALGFGVGGVDSNVGVSVLLDAIISCINISLITSSDCNNRTP